MNEIVLRIQNGEKRLMDDFIKDNFKYVENIAKKYYEIFEDYEDLIQEGLIGFVKAIYSFDTNKKYFIQYLNYKILSEINKYVYSNLDRIIDEKVRYEFAMYLYKKCENKIGYEPNVGEISSYYGLYISKAQQIYNIYRQYNIYYNIEDFKDYYNDFSLNVVDDKIDSNIFFNQLDLLTYREKEYLKLKYLNGLKTDIEISKFLNVSRQLVCNRSKNVRRKLKLVLKNEDN